MTVFLVSIHCTIHNVEKIWSQCSWPADVGLLANLIYLISNFVNVVIKVKKKVIKTTTGINRMDAIA
jgi:hypothetical protein